MYTMHYEVTVTPGSDVVDVTVTLQQPASLLREVRFRADFERLSDFSGDGNVAVEDQHVRWQPPAAGGALRWRARVSHMRTNSGYDAWLGLDWGLFRAEDIIPRAATRTRKGAQSETRWSFRLPARWSVITQYYNRDGQFFPNDSKRRFDQPTGWVAIGRLGVRRESIAGVRVAVAGPVQHALRRLDMLALLHWTLPELARILPELPRRLTIVSAADPMWRGGLSAPQSLYIHSERPLISENGTSTLLHELLHVALDLRAKPGHDWIIEGLAEFYSLELLRRSGTISASRHRAALDELRDWARSSRRLCGNRSTGATTARAVGIFVRLDREIRDDSNGASGLDDVIRALVDDGAPIGLEELAASVSHFSTGKPDALRMNDLPGCRKNMTSTRED
jgi:hypothetical protein